MKERLIKKFQEEINALDRELKLDLPKEIKRARELGDLRENAEYSAAKERQRLREARLSVVEQRGSGGEGRVLGRQGAAAARRGAHQHVEEAGLGDRPHQHRSHPFGSGGLRF